MIYCARRIKNGREAFSHSRVCTNDAMRVRVQQYARNNGHQHSRDMPDGKMQLSLARGRRRSERERERDGQREGESQKR